MSIPSWLVGVPAWGDHYVRCARRMALPNIAGALSQSVLPAHIIIHTDQPDAFADWGKDEFELSIECRTVAAEAGWNQYPEAHFDSLRSAVPGQYVSLLCADVAVSREFFIAMEQQFAAGKKAVVMAGPRTLSDEYPPLVASGRELTDWALDHLHPTAQRSFYGTGRASLPSIIYFESTNGIVKRCFHMGPVGFVLDGRQYCCEQSNDGEFMRSFSFEEIHIAQPDEMMIVECSPASKFLGELKEPFNTQHIVAWARHNTNAMHRWMFRHPILYSGVDDGSSAPIAEEILRMLGEEPSLPSPTETRLVPGGES